MSSLKAPAAQKSCLLLLKKELEHERVAVVCKHHALADGGMSKGTA
jgi:hypothetical protein